jgi:hypothetical protein
VGRVMVRALLSRALENNRCFIRLDKFLFGHDASISHL